MAKRQGIAGILPGRTVPEWMSVAGALDRLLRRALWKRVLDVPMPCSSLLAALGEDDSVLAYYAHPVHPTKSAVHEVSRDDIASFIDDRVVPAHGTGVDLIVSNRTLSRLVAFNHDGYCFVVTPKPEDQATVQ